MNDLPGLDPSSAGTSTRCATPCATLHRPRSRRAPPRSIAATGSRWTWLAEDGCARRARRHGGRGVRRRGDGLPPHMIAMERSAARARRSACLRRAQQPSANQIRQQHCRAEGEVPAGTHQRRARRRAGDERAGAGSDVISMKLKAGTRAATTSRTAARCGSPTARTPTPWWLRQDRARARRPRRDRLPDREGDEGFFRVAQKLDKLGTAAATPARDGSRTSKCRPRTCSGRLNGGAKVPMSGLTMSARCSRRADRHHAGGDGQRRAVRPRPQAVRPEHRRVPAHQGKLADMYTPAAGDAQPATRSARTSTGSAPSTCARCARTAPA